ncbi:Heme-binding protein A precursor, partial [Haemophilus influenzae]
HKNMPIN